MDHPNWTDGTDERPSQARVYDYLLGGSHNLAVDRAAAHWSLQIMPDAVDQAQANRAFLYRAVRHLLGAGVRQFLDIGSGIPTVGNVHEVAQRIDPEAKVVYVDLEPIAVAHSRHILAGNDRATAIQEDLRQPHAIVQHPEVQAMLDFQQPIALLLVAVLHAVPDEDDPHALVQTLYSMLAAGSYLAISHMTNESQFKEWETVLAVAEQAGSPMTPRTRTEIANFFGGAELVQPGLVRLPHWRPDDPTELGTDADWCNAFGGLARKPHERTPGSTTAASGHQELTPTAAGMYDFYLGGTAHTPVDRAAGEQILAVLPEVRDTAWANRGFLQRAVRRMAAEWEINQFIDIGAGLPTQRNTHEVVREAIPDGRVVYVDNDPAVVARARQMLAGVPGAAAIQADIRQPDQVLTHRDTQRLIDLNSPVGLLMVAVLHFVSDDDDPWALVASYVDAIPPGSYLAISHASADEISPSLRDATLKVYARTPSPPTERTRGEIARLFSGLEVVPPYEGAEPDVTFAGLWGAEDPEAAAAEGEGSRLFYAAVARKLTG